MAMIFSTVQSPKVVEIRGHCPAVASALREPASVENFVKNAIDTMIFSMYMSRKKARIHGVLTFLTA